MGTALTETQRLTEHQCTCPHHVLEGLMEQTWRILTLSIYVELLLCKAHRDHIS